MSADAQSLIPVSVLTGFLGAGKTTLLNRLVNHPAMEDVAVLINEFGEVGLDHLLVEQLSEDTIVLNSGCICCTVRGDMIASLTNLIKQRADGTIPKFQRIVIETTGLADPAPIIHTLMADALVVNHFKLDGIITCIDSIHGAGQLDNHEEAVKQAAIADRLVITKADLAGDAPELKQRLARLNPTAKVLSVTKGDIHPNDLFGAGLFKASDKSPDVQNWLRDEALAAQESGHHDDHHHNDVNRHDDHIRSFSIVIDAPLPWDNFTSWLEMLLATKGEQVLRVKGILAVQGVETPVVIHGVQHIFHPAATLPAWPDEDRRSRIVFITRDISKAAIEKTLLAFLDCDTAL